jgi:hypothetical protein
MMCLDIAGEPFHVPYHRAMGRFTMTELLNHWLAARQWHRDRRADAVEGRLAGLDSLALVHGVRSEVMPDYRQDVRDMVRDIRRLRAPEWLPEPEQAPMTDDDWAFLGRNPDGTLRREEGCGLMATLDLAKLHPVKLALVEQILNLDELVCDAALRAALETDVVLHLGRGGRTVLRPEVQLR